LKGLIEKTELPNEERILSAVSLDSNCNSPLQILDLPASTIAWASSVPFFFFLSHYVAQLASNSRSFYFNLPSAEIKGIHHPTHPVFSSLKSMFLFMYNILLVLFLWRTLTNTKCQFKKLLKKLSEQMSKGFEYTFRYTNSQSTHENTLNIISHLWGWGGSCGFDPQHWKNFLKIKRMAVTTVTKHFN
jgi:hypothetical protein